MAFVFGKGLGLKTGVRADQRLGLRDRLNLFQANANLPESFDIGDLLNGAEETQTCHPKFDLQNIGNHLSY